MPRPRFSEMLLDRRRQLGLSIKQASNVLRLKEEVLIAFEEGDFDSIPKSGYAQGMLSSYARYLGLNAKTVVNQFSTDLFEHERGANSHEARRRSRLNRDSSDGPLYEVPQATALGQSRGNRTYVESHGFLPTSGGFAGDMGDFATTSAARPRYSSNSSAASSRDDVTDVYPQGRPYTSRVPVSQTSISPLGQAQRQRPSTRRTSSSLQQETYGRSAYTGSGYGMQDEVTTRRVSPSQYRDDMRLDNEGRSYEAASTARGRRSSRNIASTERPNVRRRSTNSSRAQLRNRDNGPAHDGILGMAEVFFSDRTRVMVLFIVLLCLALTGTIIFSVRSCVNSQQSTGHAVTVAKSDDTGQNSADDNETSDVTKEEEDKARADAAAAKAAENDTPVSERTFEVTVADGEVTWIEITYDNKSDIAETVTGPWNRTYTVRESISINVNKTSAVTVTENGKKLEFDTKSSGIGTITIQVNKKGGTEGDQTTSSNPTDTTQGDGTTTDGQQQGDGTTTQEQQYNSGSGDTNSGENTYTDTNTGTNTSNGGNPYEGYTLDADGYYYGSDGYYDANGNFFSY